MRGEIMSAGQANLPQRSKMLGQNQPGTPAGEAEEPTATRNNNYLNTMLDGYSANNPSKKVSKKRFGSSRFETLTLKPNRRLYLCDIT